jgi:CubicO group peptidase (beta-lactamase class C family)
MLRHVLLVFLFTTAILLPCHAQRARRVITTVPELTDSIRRVMAQEHIPGLLLVLATRDSVLFAGGLGEANQATHQPVTAHTLFRIGSITKSFVSLALLQLIEQGKLRLNDEVRKIAPEVPIDNPWEATDPVRVVHLLEHTAGFDDMLPNHAINHGPVRRGVAGLAVFRAELRCRWRPGERMAYSNPGYQVAGYLLEKLSGQPYEQYLTQHLLRPLGLPDATPSQDPAALPQLAQGYLYQGGQYRPQPARVLYTGAAGSMNASAADLARYVQFYLRGGRTAGGTALVQPASLRAMETVHSTLAARSGLAAGYGLGNYSLQYKQQNASFQGHGGTMPAFTSALFYNRALGVGYALSNNGDNASSRIDQLVQQFLLRHVPRPVLPAPVALASTEAGAYLGHYRFASVRNSYQFSQELLGGRRLVRQGPLLLLQPLLGAPDTLLATGPRTFRSPSGLAANTVLARDADGRRVIVSRGYYGVEAGFWWWLLPALLALSGLLAVTAGVAGLVWLVYALRRRVPAAQVLPRVLPLPAALSLAACGWAGTQMGTYWGDLGLVTTEAVLLFAGSLMFGLCTAGGLGLLLYRFGQFRSRLAAWYLLLSYGGLVFLVVLFHNYGWLGMRAWAA